MRPTPHRRAAAIRIAALLLLIVASAACARETALDLGKAEKVADGVLLYRLNDPSLLDPVGAVAVQILRLDPAKIDLRCVLAHERPVALEAVQDMASRRHAIAAINAGFFNIKNGDPVGLLKVDGELVSDMPTSRGAVGLIRGPDNPVKLLFDRVSATVQVTFQRGGETFAANIDGVDTTRARSKLMLYTPRYGANSDTADTGVEWQLAGPGGVLHVASRRPNAGKTPIPRDGAVLSFGGTVLPSALEALDMDQSVSIETTFLARLGTNTAQWHRANDIVSGAGLLVYGGQPMQDWTDEQLRAGFNTERHPRTMIGTSKGGIIWMVTVDGRQPDISVGMTFAELQKLAVGLKLEYALNLDGGGSTTMVVNGTIVNHPSDQAGPRKVSDGIVVIRR